MLRRTAPEALPTTVAADTAAESLTPRPVRSDRTPGPVLTPGQACRGELVDPQWPGVAQRRFRLGLGLHDSDVARGSQATSGRTGDRVTMRASLRRVDWSRRPHAWVACGRRPRGAQPRRGVLGVGARCCPCGEHRPGGRTFSADPALACRCSLSQSYSAILHTTREATTTKSPAPTFSSTRRTVPEARAAGCAARLGVPARSPSTDGDRARSSTGWRGWSPPAPPCIPGSSPACTQR